MENIGEKHEGKKGGSCIGSLFKIWLVFMGVGTFLMLLYNGIFNGDFRSLKPLIFFGLLYYVIVKIIKRNPLLDFVRNKLKLDFLVPKAKSTKENSILLNGSVEIENPYAGIFICGGAGSGKSKSIIEPIIKESGEKDFSGIVYDFKYPELANYVVTAYKNSDVKTYFIDFVNVSKSNRVNPIAPHLMPSKIKAQELAFSVMVNLDDSLKTKKGDSFFSQSAVALLTACMWYLRQKHPEYCTLPHAVSMITSPDSNKLIEVLASYTQSAEIISSILTAFNSGAEKQLASQLSSAQLPLDKINTPEIFWVLSDADFDLNLNETDNKGVLTIGNNPSIQDSLSPVIALILTATMKVLNQPNKAKSIFLIDEFPTIYIPNVEQLPATARSNKVSTVLACQDISQIIDGYGRDKSDTILSNLGNQFFGRTTNIQTADRVSKIFGKYDKTKVSVSSKSWLDSSKTESTQETDLVKGTDVFQAETGSFYTLLSSGKKRLGLSKISMDETFVKSEIKLNKNVTEENINDNFDKIKEDIKLIILR